jgi:translation initiation factor IF-2
MQWEARIRENNRIMKELGMSGLSTKFSSLSRKKQLQRVNVQAARGKGLAGMLVMVKGLDMVAGMLVMAGMLVIYHITYLKLRSLMIEMMIRT